MTVRIGLTGPIGCGKSTVARWLAGAGAIVVDADELSRQVTALGLPAYDDVVERFGPAVVGVGEELDREALAHIVFADEAALRDLERIVHPAVRERIEEALAAADAAGAAAIVVEAIKLLESGLAALVDDVWLVRCDAAHQRARLLERGMGPADIERRLAAQAGSFDGSRPVGRIMTTDGPEAATRATVLSLLDSLVRPA